METLEVVRKVFLFNLIWLYFSQTKSPFIEENPSASECMNVDLKGKRPVKEYTFPSAKTTVTLKALSATRDRERLGSAGVWIGKENRSQEHEPREGDQTADLRQVSRLVWVYSTRDICYCHIKSKLTASKSSIISLFWLKICCYTLKYFPSLASIPLMPL